MARLPYQEGTWFSVPLRKGGHAVGLIARTNKKGKVVLAYFFGPLRSKRQNLIEVEHLRPSEALTALRVGDLHLMTGEWPITGVSVHFQRSIWPMPLFLRRDELSHRAWYSFYSEDNPAELLHDEPAPWDAVGVERDSVWGAGAVEIGLTRMLDPGG